jgi:hypothetical protein
MRTEAPLTTRPKQKPPSKSEARSLPEIQVKVAHAGRDTLAAIEDDLAEELGRTGRAKPAPPKRERRKTAAWDEEVPQRPSRPSRAGEAARDTTRPKAPPRAPSGRPEVEAFELVTFVLRGDVGKLSSARAQREFVSAHLLGRLPVSRADEIERIDVVPFTERSTVVMRVWCRT